MTRTRPTPPPSRVRVREAARLAGVTPQGIYQRIRRGDLAATQVGGVQTVARADVLAYRDQLRALLRPRTTPRRLTDAEFLQELRDSDPD
ncbi:MAG: helix-turn-helix domain-containing protein [Kofleriaceae bacterium]